MPSDDRFDVAMALDYYTPYVSGLTETARLVAEGLTKRGWRIAIACARHDRSLPKYEVLDGVHVYRAPVLANVRKGVLCPGLPRLAAKLAARSDLLHLHMPMPEAVAVVALARKVPLVSTYQIDAFLKPGLLNSFGMRFADYSARVAVDRSAVVVVNSHDQAADSRIWPALRRRIVKPIQCPCQDRSGGAPSYRDGAGLHIGFMGRITEEKGIEYAIRAVRAMTDPTVRLLIAGDYETVAGGSNIAQLRAEAGDDPRIRFLGLLGGTAINDFYASIDVFALPSIAESFGIVQAEAMMVGVPSVTTDIAGGRWAVQVTGFGRIVPPRDPQALRAAILEAAAMPQHERDLGRKKALELWGGDVCLDAHEELYQSVLGPRR